MMIPKRGTRIVTPSFHSALDESVRRWHLWGPSLPSSRDRLRNKPSRSLPCPEPVIGPPLLHQLGISPVLHKSSLMQNGDLIGIDARGQTVGDENGRSFLGVCGERGPDSGFRVRIEAAHRL